MVSVRFWNDVTRERLTWFFAIAAFGGTGWLIWSAREITREFRSYQWPVAKGEVFGTLVAPTQGSKGRVMYEARPRYRYQVNNADLAGDHMDLGGGAIGASSQEALSALPYREGMAVDVYYDPYAPEISTLTPGFPLRHAIAYGLLTIVSVIGWCVNFWLVRGWITTYREKHAPLSTDALEQGRGGQTVISDKQILAKIPDFVVCESTLLDWMKCLAGGVGGILAALMMIGAFVRWGDTQNPFWLFPTVVLGIGGLAGLIFLLVGISGAFEVMTMGERLVFGSDVQLIYPNDRRQIWNWTDGIFLNVRRFEEQVVEQVNSLAMSFVIKTYEVRQEERNSIELRDAQGKLILERVVKPEVGKGLMRWVYSRELNQQIENQGGSVEWGQSSIRKISLRGCAITDQEFQELADGWKFLKELDEIDIENTRLSDGVVPILVQLVKQQPMELHVAGSHISPQGRETLANGKPLFRVG